MRMPHASTYDARYRGFASRGCRYCQMWGSREAARPVGCYHLTMRYPIRRQAIPYDGVDGTEPCPCMPPCPEPSRCKPKPPCPEPETCEELLENVAKAEMALAQTMNAEGEKFIKIIESTDDFDALLEADRAVSRTMDDVICKEQALFRELQRILETCGACEPKPKDTRAPGKPDRRTFPGYIS